MDQGSLDKTLARIEAALKRIENAAARQDEAAGELRARHEGLKAAVSKSLSQLDELIAGQRQ
jgi:hypothetical protein